MKNSRATHGVGRAVAIVFMPFMSFMVTLVFGQNQQAPVFKSKVEVVQLDVSVLDRNRQPVRGLTQKDFTILEDGKPQPIVGFSAFDIHDEAPPATGWMKDVPPDVTTNELKDSRLFVIVMDDALIPQEPFSIKSSREIARSIIDKLGANDMTAVVFTGDNRKTQDFTNDKTKLIAAIDKFNPGLANYMFGTTSEGVDVDNWFYLSSIRTVSSVADFLIAAPNRRKAVLWVSPGVPMDLTNQPTPAVPYIEVTDGGLKVKAPPPPRSPGIDLRTVLDKTDELFRRAQRSNVTIYPIDPTGLGGMMGYLMSRIKGDPVVVETFVRQKIAAMNDYIVSAATNTGGRVVMNTNEFDPEISEIFDENKSYYLIGFEPTNPAADGTLRRLTVKVNRPDVEVRTRSGYYAPEPEKPAKGRTVLTAETTELGKAISGLLPVADLPLKVMTAPFAVPGQRLAAVTVVLGIQQPVPPSAADARITEATELQISAFTPEGDPRGTQRYTAQVAIRQGADGMAAYEVLGRIDLPAGRYRLRIAATNATSAKTGSVFTDVTVPDYSNVPFSISPIVLGATPGRVSAPKDLLASLLPITPTAEREFAMTDKVEAFLRLYESGQKPVDRVSVSIRVLDKDDQVRASEVRTIAVDQFGVARDQANQTGDRGTLSGRASPQGVSGVAVASQPTDRFANPALRFADARYQIPLSALTPGAYLLRIEAALGSTTIRRDVRFSVR